MTLRGSAIQAVRWTTLSSFFRGGLQFVQLTVLARLLLPTEFGLVATTAAFVSIGSVVADLGLNSAYLQARSIDEEERSALYFINVISGILLTLLFLSISPFAEYIIGDPRIAPLLRIYSLVFLITALGLQIRYDAEKRLDFRPVAILEMVATMSGVTVGIIAAATGSGAASIIYGTITTASVSTALCWIFLSNGWRPMFGARLSRARRFLVFGFAVIGNGLVTQLSTSLDTLIGGRLIGANHFGLYAGPRNLFLQILSLINPIVTRVGFPLVAHLDNDRDRVARIYSKALETIMGISAPIYLGAAVFADPLVLVVFGERWIDAIPVFRLLALWALCKSVMNPLGILLLGMGRPGLALKWNFAQLALAMVVLPFAGGFGGFGLAAVMFILIIVQLVPGWYFLVHPLCNMSFVDYFSSILRPVSCSLVSVVLSAIFLKNINSVLIYLLSAFILVFFIYVLISWLFRALWLDLVLDQFGVKIFRYNK